MPPKDEEDKLGIKEIVIPSSAKPEDRAYAAATAQPSAGRVRRTATAAIGTGRFKQMFERINPVTGKSETVIQVSPK